MLTADCEGLTYPTSGLEDSNERSSHVRVTFRSVVSLKTLCAAVVHLSPGMKPGLEIYNLIAKKHYSVRQLASMVARHLKIDWNERSLPLPLARVAARVGDVFSTVTGKQFPLTSSRLEALVETTHFSCAKLLSTGFRHPQTTEEGLEDMVKWYRRSGGVGGRRSEDGGQRSEV